MASRVATGERQAEGTAAAAQGVDPRFHRAILKIALARPDVSLKLLSGGPRWMDQIKAAKDKVAADASHVIVHDAAQPATMRMDEGTGPSLVACK